MNIRSAAAMALTVISSAAFNVANAADSACGAGTCGKKTTSKPKAEEAGCSKKEDAGCSKKEEAGCSKQEASCSKQEASCSKQESSCSKK